MTLYAQPDLRKTILQIVETFLPHFGFWALMIFTVKQRHPFGATLILSLFAVAWHVRIFILFHDCTHHSYSPPNELTGSWAISPES